MEWMIKTNLFVIAKGGITYVSFSLLAAIIFAILGFNFLSLLAVVFFLAFSFVFRNPERELLNFESQSILSPVDGVVTAIEAIEDQSEYGFCITIRSDYTHVSLLRTPINGQLEKFSLTKGAKLASSSKHFETLNENALLTFKDESGNRVRVKHYLTQSFAPLYVDVLHGDKLMKTTRYGLMACGLTKVYLTSDVRVNVSIGSDVKASQTLLGFFS